MAETRTSNEPLLAQLKRSRMVRTIERASPGRERLLFALSSIGYAIGLAAAIVLIRHDGGHGYDSYAYWLAGRNVLEGQPLYFQHAEGALGAYRYPPLFAQLWAPFTLMPALAFSWVVRIICLLCVRYLAGSWRNVGLWLLVPLTLTELSVANVTFPMAVMTVMALNGRAWMAPWAAALKIGPVLVMPYLWFARPAMRRTLIAGLLVLAAACTVSFGLTPDSWMLYVQSLGWLTAAETESFGVVRLVPSGLLDFAWRFALGGALVAFAIRRGSDRMAFTATIIAVPVLAIWRLVPLLAVPRLRPSR
jgi:hypothetical protein